MSMKFSREDRLWREANQEGWWRFRTPARYIFFLFLVILLIVGGWFLFSSTPLPVSTNDLPLIEPSHTSYRTKVDDTYVASIPHQDKLIYDRISGDAHMQQVEHILPSPEVPRSLIQRENQEPILVNGIEDEAATFSSGPAIPMDEETLNETTDTNISEENTTIRMETPYEPSMEEDMQPELTSVNAEESQTEDDPISAFLQGVSE